MSALARALGKLASNGAVLAPERAGRGFGVFPGGDRRRRPLARISAAETQTLISEGALVRAEGAGFILSEAGRARVRRDAAAPAETFIAQHAPIGDRAVIDSNSDMRNVRGLAQSNAIAKLAALRAHDGKSWLTGAELEAARRLIADWEASQAGLVRGSDWSAPPMSSAGRGAGNAQERALAARCDARRRFAEALDALSPPLRRVVESVCLREEGLEALERAEHWPPRSAKLALKLGLSQLAQALAASRAS